MGRRAKRVAIASLAAGLVCGLALAPGIAGAAKKGPAKKGPAVVDLTKAVNLPIPDRAAGMNTPFGALNSIITVGNQFKGKKIRDVNVTVQATGTGMNAVNDLRARLTAPNGATSTLFLGLNPGNVLGPLTLDDESSLSLGEGTNRADPQALFSPWIGTAQPGSELFVMDGGAVSGNWTLKVVDRSNLDTNVLNSWRLNVAAGKAFQTK